MVNWGRYHPFRRNNWRLPGADSTGIKYVRRLTTVNLFVFVIRLVQSFFAGVVTGIMAYYIHLLKLAHQTVPAHFIFALVVPVFALTTQIIYCLEYEHNLYFLWDLCTAIGFLLSFFWFYDGVRSTLTCGWGAFNPFGADRCAQTRSVLVMQIILASLWLCTALMGAYSRIRNKKELIAKLDV